MRINRFSDGVRIRQQVKNNRARTCYEKDTIRIEAVINKTDKFHGHRHKPWQSPDEKKSRRLMRKDVVEDVKYRLRRDADDDQRYGRHSSSLPHNVIEFAFIIGNAGTHLGLK